MWAKKPLARIAIIVIFTNRIIKARINWSESTRHIVKLVIVQRNIFLFSFLFSMISTPFHGNVMFPTISVNASTASLIPGELVLLCKHTGFIQTPPGQASIRTRISRRPRRRKLFPAVRRSEQLFLFYSPW